MKRTKILAYAAAAAVTALPLVAAASTAQFQNPIKANSVEELLVAILKFAVRIATVVCVLGIVWSGFLFVKAQGNEEGLKKAKRAFFFSVIGTILMLGAEVIATAIQKTISSIS